MADEVEVAVPQPTASPARATPDLPKGGPFNAYGKPISAAAVMVVIFTFMDKDPAQGMALLERFGIRWLFYCGLLYVVYDLLKIVIKQLSRLVSHIGNWAQASQQAAVSQARLADGVQAIASKGDRAMEEQQRLTTFSVNASQRSVELTQQNGDKIDAVALVVADHGKALEGHGRLLESIAEKVGANVGT